MADPNTGTNARFRLAYALRHFYDNGGGRCYIVSIGDYAPAPSTADIVDAHLAGLNALAREDEPTLLVFPDLSGMAPADAGRLPRQVAAVRASYHSVLVQALNQCATLGDRFLICDLWDGGVAGQRRDHRVPQRHRHPKSEIWRGVSPVHPDHHALELERRARSPSRSSRVATTTGR